ncbi:hypothetical protein [Paenibacillus taichungensis]|uniref:hypothetical protein n=1 Tax=Paenibacillus taichungensis TaxID=484184 RepID=UPI0039A3429A
MKITKEEYLQILNAFDFIDEVFCTVENDAKLIEKLFYELDKIDQSEVREKTSRFLKIHDMFLMKEHFEEKGDIDSD